MARTPDLGDRALPSEDEEAGRLDAVVDRVDAVLVTVPEIRVFEPDANAAHDVAEEVHVPPIGRLTDEPAVRVLRLERIGADRVAHEVLRVAELDVRVVRAHPVPAVELREVVLDAE